MTPSRPLPAAEYTSRAGGLITVTLQIAYLPALYSTFNRREDEIPLLNSRAGTRWAADITDSHVTYLSLVCSMSIKVPAEPTHHAAISLTHDEFLDAVGRAREPGLTRPNQLGGNGQPRHVHAELSQRSHVCTVDPTTGLAT